MLKCSRWLVVSLGLSLSLALCAGEASGTSATYTFPPVGNFGFSSNSKGI